MHFRRFPIPLWAIFFLTSLGLALATSYIPAPGHRLEYAQIVNERGMPLRVVLFFPQPAVFERAPAAIICQPLNNPPEYSRTLALELVRDGFVVLTFEWRGRTREENRQLLRSGVPDVLRADALAAVAYLRQLPGVNPEQVVIAGHSVGGTMAIEAGFVDANIAGVASIGMEAEVTPQSPRNLLWTMGLYDEFRLLNRMRDFFRASAGTVAMENTTVGDFGKGTARRLGISPMSDHFTELQDGGIHREVVQWFRRSLGLPDSSRRFWMSTRSELYLLAWAAALIGALLFATGLSGSKKWVLRVTVGAALLAVVLLSRVRGPGFLLAADAILGLLIFALLAGFLAAREPKVLARGWRIAARFVLLAWLSVFLTLVVNNIASFIHEPGYLLRVPEFAVRHVLDALCSYVLVYSRPLLFSAYNPETIAPQLWVYAVMAIEALFPGILLGPVARIARPRRQPKAAGRPLPVVGVVILALLVVVLLVVGWLRIQQGFLTGESALAALRFLLRFTVLPIFLFTLLWRWTRRTMAEQSHEVSGAA